MIPAPGAMRRKESLYDDVGQPSGECREDGQNQHHKQHGEKVGDNIFENGSHGYVRCGRTHGEYVDTYGRGDLTHFHENDADYAEPYGIKAQRADSGEDGGQGKQDHGDNINHAAQNEVENHHAKKDDISVGSKPCDKIRQFKGHAGDGEETAQQTDAHQNNKQLACNLCRGDERGDKAVPGHAASGNGIEQSPGCPNCAALCGTEKSREYAAKHHGDEYNHTKDALE